VAFYNSPRFRGSIGPEFLGIAPKGNRTLEKPLAGQVALVTGAGRGLGRAFAERLAALGCDIVVHGMRENGPAEYGEGTTLTDVARQIGAQFGVRTIRVLGDLTLSADVERVVQTATAELGPVGILVHNAGGDVAAAGGKPNPNDAVMVKEIDVKAVLDRNLLSTILICQQTARGMMERRGGRIITISSIAAFKGNDTSVIYSTAKAAVVEYTRCLAVQLRPYNITVNSLAPGDTRTGRFLGTRHVPGERLVSEGTLDRVALVDEVARVIEFFAGPLGDFVTGQVLRVDGGTQCWSA
jgi:3-oxoacyl-[acyl-carrier protein] reductase